MAPRRRFTPKDPALVQAALEKAELARVAFAEVPALIAAEGRIRGFERLRDIVLDQWELLTDSPLTALKMALETDRHALFSEIAEQKTKGMEQNEKWQQYQQYLKGEIDVPSPDVGTKEDAAPAAKGPKRGKSVEASSFEEGQPDSQDESAA